MSGEALRGRPRCASFSLERMPTRVYFTCASLRIPCAWRFRLIQAASNAPSLASTSAPVWDLGLNGTGQVGDLSRPGLVR